MPIPSYEPMTDQDWESINKFQRNVGKWNAYNFPNKVGGDEPFLGMVEELGELAHALLKLRQGIRGMNPVKANALAKDAIGDLHIYTNDFCNQMGWLNAACMQQAWDEVKLRDWITYPETGRPPVDQMADRIAGNW